MDHAWLPEATDEGGFAITSMAISIAIFCLIHQPNSEGRKTPLLRKQHCKHHIEDWGNFLALSLLWVS